MNKKDLIHIKFMQRCLDLASLGLGQTYPNPLVGCILVHKEKIVSEGWHQKKGEAHAEVHAIQNLKDKPILNQCTLYVNLEPCNHYGATPPCSDLIISSKIPKVVIGCSDPFEKVNGKGIERLKANGCEVVFGVLEKESKELNKRFFTYHLKKRPYIILKWAQSSDGFIAPLKKNRLHKEPFWLSSETSKLHSHFWRSQEQSILVGVQTVIDDNPKLTNRKVKGSSPLRIVIDLNDRIPKNAILLNDKYPTLVFSSKKKISNKEIIVSDLKNILPKIMSVLFEKNIQSLIVEGGTRTIQKFIDQNLWDEARTFISPKKINDGIRSPLLNDVIENRIHIEKDVLQISTPSHKKEF
tara:strand:- start:769 stop:1830 length:1062 start_codon:yes stop_codon:yes gene_type:complete